MKPHKTDIYQSITDRIISLLETVKVSDYQQTWIKLADDGPPRNPASGHYYSGVNTFLLSLVMYISNYPYNQWMTLRHANDLGARIRKGASGCPICFVGVRFVDADGKPLPNQSQYQQMDPAQRSAMGITATQFLRGFHVFNLQDVEGLPAEMYTATPIEPLQPWQMDEHAEQILNASGATVQYVKQNHAYYTRNTDTITLPEREQFTSTAGFYKTVFHELAHWTGHPSRLNRDPAPRGTEAYAIEELVAELATAYVCATLGYESRITSNAAYINGWLQALRNDKRFIFQATGKAQAAANFITEIGQHRLSMAA